MKLDTKKVLYISIIFFSIALFWQTYDMLVARILIDKFGLNQTLSGLVMALDNIMAVILLPLFGALSDKSNAKRGRRTPYIIVGTVLAAFAFMALSFSDEYQSMKIQSTDIISEHYDVAFSSLADLNDPQHWQLVVDNMANERLESYQAGLISGRQYDDWNNQINLRMQSIIDYNPTGLNTRNRSIMQDVYFNYLSSRAWELTAHDATNFYVFISILFVSLVAMAIYRSPAVALMPDTTPKPLRSKANAIMNLMGAAGGILAINIIMFSGLNRHTYDSRTATYIITGIVMLIMLGLFLWKVREPQWAKERKDEEERLGLATNNHEEADNARNLSAEKRLSLYFLLASVFLWFAGYNAVMTKIADYMPKVLNMNFYEVPFVIAQVVVVLMILPIGILSMHAGRKKMVIIGILMSIVGLASIFFVHEGQRWLIAGIIAFAGVGWASININSYPMVVELAKGSSVGKYTGYYYSASMTAQIFTPIFSGFLMDRFGRLILFPYGAAFVALSLLTFIMVKHGDARIMPEEALEDHEIDRGTSS